VALRPIAVRQKVCCLRDLTHGMRRPPNPYRVLAHALDAGDRRLAEVLTLRLARVGLSGSGSVAAEATVDRLMKLLGVSGARG